VCRDGAGVEEVLGVGEELSDPAATRNSDHAGDVGGDVRDRDEAMATTDRKTRLTAENWEETALMRRSRERAETRACYGGLHASSWSMVCAALTRTEFR
jgi:hypothetical protein